MLQPGFVAPEGPMGGEILRLELRDAAAGAGGRRSPGDLHGCPRGEDGAYDQRLSRPMLPSDISTYTINVELHGARHTFSARADQTILAAAEAAGIDLPNSCCSGVCTTCAALLRSGSVHQPDAMGVKAELQQQGYALLCVSFPRSDLEVLGGQEDALYETQFGQYQK